MFAVHPSASHPGECLQIIAVTLYASECQGSCDVGHILL